MEENETKNWYAIPYELHEKEKYEKYSIEFIVLYGIGLDRQNLSIKNGWKSGDGKPFIFFTIPEIMKICRCAKQKAHKVKQEMIDAGVWEVTKQAKNKPDMIHVVPLIEVGNNEIAPTEKRIEPKKAPESIKKQHQEEVAKDEKQSEEIDKVINPDKKIIELSETVAKEWNQTGLPLNGNTKGVFIKHIDAYGEELVINMIKIIKRDAWGKVGVGHYLAEMKKNETIEKAQIEMDAIKEKERKTQAAIERTSDIHIDYDQQIEYQQQPRKRNKKFDGIDDIEIDLGL